MVYKGYSLPKDIKLIIKTLLLLLYYSILLLFTPITGIIQKTATVSKKNVHSDQFRELVKVWRCCNWLLSRLFRTNKPCLRRSLVLYRWCNQYSMNAKIVIGASKKGKTIDGHSWVEIDGTPLMENPEVLKKYVKMIEG